MFKFDDGEEQIDSSKKAAADIDDQLEEDKDKKEDNEVKA